MRARGERLEDDGGGCGAGGEGEGVAGVLEGSYCLFKVVSAYFVRNARDVQAILPTGWDLSFEYTRTGRWACRQLIAQRWWRGKSAKSAPFLGLRSRIHTGSITAPVTGS